MSLCGPRAKNRMDRIAQIGLISAMVWAVLAFGGTEPLSFSVAQILLLALGMLLVLTHGSGLVARPRFPVAVPLLLVALVLLQIVPLPTSVVHFLRGGADLSTDTSHATISISGYDTVAHLLLLLTYLAAFYLTLIVCQRRDGKERLVYALLALGAFEAFYGLVNYLSGWQPLRRYTREGLDPVGTYINHNHFAGLLEMILPFAVALAFCQVGRSHRAPVGVRACRWNAFVVHSEAQNLFFWLFFAVILFTALVFSQSRMGILAALFSVLLVVSLFSSAAKQKRIATVLSLLFLSAGILMALWIGVEPVITRFELIEMEFVPEQSRWAIWQDTLRLIPAHLLLGSGLGTFPVAYTSSQTAFLAKFVTHAHNDYLQIVSDLGLGGGLLLFASILLLLLRTVRRACVAESGFTQAAAMGCSGALLAILLHSLTDFNLYIPGNALVFAVVLGIAWSTHHSDRDVVNRVSRAPS